MGRRQISEAVQAHLRGFTERQRERAMKRQRQLATHRCERGPGATCCQDHWSALGAVA